MKLKSSQFASAASPENIDFAATLDPKITIFLLDLHIRNGDFKLAEEQARILIDQGNYRNDSSVCERMARIQKELGRSDLARAYRIKAAAIEFHNFTGNAAPETIIH